MDSMLEGPPIEPERGHETLGRRSAASVVTDHSSKRADPDDGRVDDPVRRMLQDELQHRYRNALTLAVCIMRGSLREADCQEQGLADAERRLSCLASVNERLMLRHPSASNMREICEDALQPFVGRDHLSKITGPDARVSEDVGAALSLTIHELATNALKHGALSAPGGWVEIRWSARDDDRGGHGLHVAWSEHGCPVVPPPTRTGFGTKLIDAVLARHVRDGVSRVFDAEGFRCVFVIDLTTATGRS